MRLLELKEHLQDIHISKDASFSILGLTSNKYGSDEKILTFLSSKNNLREFRENENISAVICTNELVKEIQDLDYLGICISDNPKYAFFKLHNSLVENTQFYGCKEETKIKLTANIHESAIIANKDVKIGENTIIEANVVINEGTEIGDNVIIKSGAVIGTDGFQYVVQKNDVYRVRSSGKVVISDNVEIHSNTCIEKGVLGGSTIIGKNTKIDNLVLVGHDVKIGERCIITTGVKIGGRAILENDIFMGISSAVRNGVYIESKARISMGAIVTQNIRERQVVSGNFAIEHNKYIDFIRSIK